MRALIVDDEPSICVLLSRILVRDFACETGTASNGLEALELLGRESYDFVLLDLLMPVMSGIETLQTIRRDDYLKHLPVAVMSTVREESRVRQSIELGVGTYMTKPLRPGEVSQRLSRFVSGLAASRTGAPPTGRSCSGLQPGSRILIVHDDRDYRHFVRSQLSPTFVVAAADNGAQGLRMAMEQPPALVIVGPELGAVRLSMFLEKLRKLKGLATVPVVATVDDGSGPPAAGIDAVIDRTLVAATFLQQFDGLG